MNGPTRLAAGTEAEVRRIVREEIAAMLGLTEDAADRFAFDSDSDRLDSSAMAAVEKVAAKVGRQIVCPHGELSGWGDNRCRRCGRKMPETDQENKREGS